MDMNGLEGLFHRFILAKKTALFALILYSLLTPCVGYVAFGIG